MKPKTLCALSALFAFPLWAVPPEFPEIKPLEFQIPKAERFELSNRLIVYLLENHTLPQVQITALVRAGSLYDPQDKIGLAGIFAALLPYGGTKKMDPDSITRELELMGSSISASADKENVNIGLFSLAKNFKRTFEIFSLILREPKLDAKKLDVEKQKTLGAIARRNDEPRAIVRREFQRMLYGPKSPWGRRIEADTIKSISKKDLTSFHIQYFHPNNMILAVSGDIDEKELKDLLERHLGEALWGVGSAQFSAIEAVNPKTTRQIYLVDKPEAEQTAIRIGHFGIKRNSPDYFAFTLMNELLGGGFTSRLFRNVRSRKGLAYAVGSGFTDPLDWGVFFAGIGTKADSTYKAIQEVLNELQTLKDVAPSDEEVETAKNQLVNSYIQNFSTPHETVVQIAQLEFYDYPKDYLDNYTQNLSEVTKEDIARVASKYLNPDNSVILAVGNPKKFDRDLSVFGEIRILDPEKGTVAERNKKTSQ